MHTQVTMDDDASACHLKWRWFLILKTRNEKKSKRYMWWNQKSMSFEVASTCIIVHSYLCIAHPYSVLKRVCLVWSLFKWLILLPMYYKGKHGTERKKTCTQGFASFVTLKQCCKACSWTNCDSDVNKCDFFYQSFCSVSHYIEAQ